MIWFSEGDTRRSKKRSQFMNSLRSLDVNSLGLADPSYVLEMIITEIDGPPGGALIEGESFYRDDGLIAEVKEAMLVKWNSTTQYKIHFSYNR